MSVRSVGTSARRHWLRLAGLGLVMMSLTAGCGSDSDGDSGAASQPSAGAGSGALQIHYDYVREEDGSEGAGGRVVIDVIVRGTDQSRVTMAWYYDGEEEADETFLTIRDGNRALMYNEDAEPAYTVMEAADEHPDEFFLSSPLDPDSPQLQQACPGAKQSGSRTILGRDAVGYACPPSDPCTSTQSEEIWLDAATRLLLEHGVQKAQKVIVDPIIDETTFSTTPPDGADVHVVKATGRGAPSPSESESKRPELSPADTLRKVAATSPTPIYYYGAEFEGEALCEISISANGSEVIGDLSLDGGERVTVWYGRDFQMWTEPFIPQHYDNMVGCERLDPLRGVPTVKGGGEVTLFTADLVVNLGNLAYEPDKLARAAAALHVAGQEPNSDDLPAPPARNVALVDKACGANPGEMGQPME